MRRRFNANVYCVARRFGVRTHRWSGRFLLLALAGIWLLPLGGVALTACFGALFALRHRRRVALAVPARTAPGRLRPTL